MASIVDRKPVSYEAFFEAWNKARKSEKITRLGQCSREVLISALTECGIKINTISWGIYCKEGLVNRVKGSWSYYVPQATMAEEDIKNAHKELYPSFYKKKEESLTPIQKVALQKTISDYSDAELLKELERRGYLLHKKMEGKRWIAVPAPSPTTVVKIITETIVGK